MVFGLLSAVAAVTTTVGVSEGVREGRRQQARDEHRERDYNLVVTTRETSRASSALNGAKIVLKDNRLWVDAREDAREELYPFTGFYMAWPYPDKLDHWRSLGFARGDGFVTSTNEEQVLNWVYVDKDTYAVKHGVRIEADPHKVGPWDCTKIDKRVTFEGWEGFIAVQEHEGDELWALYFDCNDSGKVGNGKIGKKMVEVDLWRREMKRTRLQTLKDQVERMDEREKLKKEEQEEEKREELKREEKRVQRIDSLREQVQRMDEMERQEKARIAEDGVDKLPLR